MKNVRMKALIPAVLLLAGEPAWSEDLMACFGDEAVAPFALMNAQEVLLGRTVTVHFYSLKSYRHGYNNPQFDPKPLTRTFRQTMLVEAEGKAKVENDITFEGDGWCRQDELEGKKKCYSVAVAPQGIRDAPPFVEVELVPDGDFCKMNIVGKIEGINIPQGGVPAPASAPRRGARGS